jgi:threonine/homoserine/homoserine lactone efflux protein
MTLPSGHHLITFVLAASVLIAIPGPNHLYIASRSAASGRARGIAAAVGVEIGTAVHVLLAAVGLSTVLAASASAFAAVRVLGAAYLFFLAWRVLHAHSSGAVVEATGDRRISGEMASAAVVNLFNPKVILFLVAFVPQFLEPRRGPVWGQIVVLGGVLVVMGLASNLVYALAASAIADRLRRSTRSSAPLSAGRVVQALIYTVLGVLALLTKPATRN